MTTAQVLEPGQKTADSRAAETEQRMTDDEHERDVGEVHDEQLQAVEKEPAPAAELRGRASPHDPDEVAVDEREDDDGGDELEPPDPASPEDVPCVVKRVFEYSLVVYGQRITLRIVPETPGRGACRTGRFGMPHYNGYIGQRSS